MNEWKAAQRAQKIKGIKWWKMIQLENNREKSQRVKGLKKIFKRGSLCTVGGALSDLSMTAEKSISSGHDFCVKSHKMENKQT